jgi:protein O-GlcNAc transferase
MIFRDKIDELATGEAFAKRMEKSAEAVAMRLVENQQHEFQQREQAYQDQIRALTAAVTALTQQQAQPGAPPGINDALIQLAQGKPEAAEAIFQSVVARKASDIDEAATALRHLGALAFLHDTTKSLQAYRRVVELDPDNAEGWTQLGHLLVRTGQVDHAVDAYRKVLTRGEETSDDRLLASAYGNLGNVYQVRGDLDQAEAMYRRSLELNEALGRKEGMANDYGNLGNVYRIRGDLDQAEAMYRRSLELYQEIRAAPQIEQVQNLLDALRA